VFDITAPGGLISFAAPTVVAGTSSDLFVVQIPTSLTMSVEDEIKEEKEEISLLKNQVKELGKMMRALMVHIPDEEEKELEYLPNPRLIRGNGEIYESKDKPIRDSIGHATPVTTPSDMASKKGWFGVQ